MLSNKGVLSGRYPTAQDNPVTALAPPPTTDRVGATMRANELVEQVESLRKRIFNLNNCLAFDPVPPTAMKDSVPTPTRNLQQCLDYLAQLLNDCHNVMSDNERMI